MLSCWSFVVADLEMKPFPLEIKFNAEGDLLFSASKDDTINVWYSHNGERLGTYSGHNGTVWSIDVDCTFFPNYPLLGSPQNEGTYQITL